MSLVSFPEVVLIKLERDFALLIHGLFGKVVDLFVNRESPGRVVHVIGVVNNALWCGYVVGCFSRMISTHWQGRSFLASHGSLFPSHLLQLCD